MEQARVEMYLIAKEIEGVANDSSMGIFEMRKAIAICCEKLKALAARRDWIVSEKDFLE